MRGSRGSDAVALAGVGAESWRAAVHAQQAAQTAHGQIYELAGYLVETLAAMNALTGVLDRQISTYRRRGDLYDDGGDDPRQRLQMASRALRQARKHVHGADRALNTFWSEIGHIGTETEHEE